MDLEGELVKDTHIRNISAYKNNILMNEHKTKKESWLL